MTPIDDALFGSEKSSEWIQTVRSMGGLLR